jgi:hypothetical protein
MKNMKKILFLASFAVLCMACDSFLDTENLTRYDSSNFPRTTEDADKIVAGVYAQLNRAIASVPSSYYYMSELASDERFGGGGENDKDSQAIDKLMNLGANQNATFWQRRYEGIFRANSALDNLTKTPVDANTMKVYQGEIHFLRAFYFHELAEMFGEVPLVLTTEPLNLPRADIDLIYGQIAYDLSQAIELLPAVNYKQTLSGHATKWAAETIMARVFLFYTGFYGKESLPLGDGTGANTSGSITKQQVISWLEDCINNSGHDLVPDYRLLWSYSNSATAPEYPFVSDLKSYWTDEHAETVFAVKYSAIASWNNGSTTYSNQYCIYFGLRADNGGENTFPFGVGWGAGPVNSTLWEDWKKAEPTDLRRKASILSVKEGEESELPAGKSYIWGADKQMEETGFWQKKYTTVRAHDNTGKLRNSFASILWTNTDEFQLSWPADFLIMRLSDVLLMHSELTGTANGINRVRARVGLPAVAYSTEALRNERRFELAFEGRRWADIRRWGIAADLLEKQVGVQVWNRGLPEPMKSFAGGYKARYNQTKGFFQLPKTQLDLSNGTLLQTEGWGTADVEFTNW